MKLATLIGPDNSITVFGITGVSVFWIYAYIISL